MKKNFKLILFWIIYGIIGLIFIILFSVLKL